MKKVVKLLILVFSFIGLLYLGLIIWLNYNEKKNIMPVALKAEVNFIVTRINNYCAAEEMKIQLGQVIEPICDDDNKIINNMLSISNIGLFEKLLTLHFDGQVKNIELQYKDYKYIYRIDNRDIIITDINDNSHDYKENELDNNESNKTENNNDNVINGDNEDDNVTNDNNDEEDNFNEDYSEPVTSEVVDKIIVDNDIVKSLYKKYISYTTYETNNYKNINVNDSSSDEYLVKYAIYKILEDNNVNIKNYVWSNSNGDSYASYYRNGYKVTTDQINKYIKDNFNVQRTIDFDSLDLQFVVNGNDADIAYYYNEAEKAYRLVADSSIPKTGAGNIIKYSKYNSHEINGDELIIYTEFFILGNDMGWVYLNNNMDNVNFVITVLGDMADIDVEYVLNNHNNKIGKFKHVFKNINGNYYWVSTTQTN